MTWNADTAVAAMLAVRLAKLQAKEDLDVRNRQSKYPPMAEAIEIPKEEEEDWDECEK